MFDLDATKFLIVGAAALIFIPPKDLPRVMRQAGQFVGKMKRMASEFQGQFMDAMREADMADLRKEAQQLSQSTRVDLGLDQLNARMTESMGTRAVAPSTKVPAYDPTIDARLPDASAEPVTGAGVGHHPGGAASAAIAKSEATPENAAHSA